MHLSSRPISCPETVSRSQWPVQGGPTPVSLAARLEGNFALHIIQPGHTHWWIIKRESRSHNHNEQAEHQAYAPANICKTEGCLHHSAPSGHPMGAPFSSKRHVNVTLLKGLLGKVIQATQIRPGPGCSFPSKYSTP